MASFSTNLITAARSSRPLIRSQRCLFGSHPEGARKTRPSSNSNMGILRGSCNGFNCPMWPTKPERPLDSLTN